MNKQEVLEKIKNNIIISVQAQSDEPLYDENCMLAMMKSVINGGAKGLRVANVRDVKNAKENFDVPIIGITKPHIIPQNYKELVYITPTVRDCVDLIDSGADIVAFDATVRKKETNENNSSIDEIITTIKNANKLAMADIATFEEAQMAYEKGVDIISTTLSGYTVETENISPKDKPDFELLQKITSNLNVPVILEGKIWEPNDVKKAFELQAFSVVIGSSVTRPQLIVKRFIDMGLKR